MRHFLLIKILYRIRLSIFTFFESFWCNIQRILHGGAKIWILFSSDIELEVPLHCLVNCFGLWLNSSLKWTSLCHMSYYFLLFPHGWLRSVLHIDPFRNLPLHASNFIIIIIFFSHDLGIQIKKNSFYRFCKYLELGVFVNSNPMFFLCLLYRSWCRTVKHMLKKREV